MISVIHDSFSQQFEMKQHADIINANLTALMEGYKLNKLLCKNGNLNHSF